MMRVTVLCGDVTVGAANLARLDPPMGVAFGPFEPSGCYDQHAHANVIEGEYIGDKGASLVVFSDDHGKIDCVGIAIEDFAEGIGERELTLFGISSPEYAQYFSEYEDYKAYYPSN